MDPYGLDKKVWNLLIPQGVFHSKMSQGRGNGHHPQPRAMVLGRCWIVHHTMVSRFRCQYNGSIKMPVWVRLHNLPLHFWHQKALTAIGNTLGKHIKTDAERHLKGIFTFTRICVEVDLSQGLPKSIILNFNNTQWTQPLDYESIAFRCRGCQQTGHLHSACPRASPNRNK